MALPLVGAALAAPVIGGIAGRLMSSGDRKRANEALKRALAQYDNINIPDTEKMRLALETPEVQGILQPYMQQAEQLAGTEMAGIETDPRLRNAQMLALESLSRMGAEGLTAEDRAALNLARRQTAGDEQARQNAILQNMAQRGAGGSGLELAARLSSSQASADRAVQESDRTMAMAQRRMLESLSAAGQLGGQIRGQEFGEQESVARAKDEIARFNLGQRAATQAANVGALNDAQLRNLMERQRIADTGVELRNRQQQFNTDLLQREFENRMGLASARANALTGQAAEFQRRAASTANMGAQIGSGIGQAGLTYAAMNKPGTADTTETDTVDRKIEGQNPMGAKGLPKK